ncbi:MAG TPA: tol-pal system protein YbgF [Steroidobacteraceae bacterium]
MHSTCAELLGRFPTRRVGAVAIALVAALGAGCASTPAADDPIQLKLNDIDARVTRIERIISNQSLVELAQHLDQVQSDVRQLRGRVEELEYNSEAMHKQQRDLYSDLDKRIAALGGGSGAGAAALGGSAVGGAAAAGSSLPQSPAGATGSAGPPTGAAEGPDASGTSEEQRVYAQSFDALKAGSYSVAITSFKSFLSSYPASPLAENAQYWLGEAFYVTRDFDSATGAFRNVLQKWPDSRKAPDALLKLGYTQLEQKKVGEGRATLSQVVQKYPGTDAAKLAADRLKNAPAK